MEQFIYVLIVMQAAFMCFYTLHICCAGGNTAKAAAGGFSAFAAVLAAAVSFVGNCTGGFILAGFLYLLPAYFLYHRQISYLFMVLCVAGVYSFLIFMLAEQAASFIPAYYEIALFALQSVLYLISAYFFWNFIQEKFIYILHNVGKETKRQVLLKSVCWFFLLAALNAIFSSCGHRPAALIATLAVGIAVVLSYKEFYTLLMTNQNAELFKLKSELDVTTGLKNRSSFYDDINGFIKLNQPFIIIFMDLDNFKSINDLYGHHMGDRYLQVFSHSVQYALKGMGRLYRISGDEFVFLHHGTEEETVRMKMDVVNEKKELILGKSKIPFFGVSYGISRYPDEGKELDLLLTRADTQMYRQKTERKEMRIGIKNNGTAV